MLRTAFLSHSYTGTQRFVFPDLNCNSSESILVLGESGVGKTTLLHILAGILKPTNGDVFVQETSLYNLSGNQLDKFRGKNIGLIFQKPHFVQSITAEENLMLTQNMAGQSSDNSKIDYLLSSLNIDHRAKAKPHTMSQGEQQRLSIARALINEPKIILADEPTSALDDKNCQQVVDLLKQQSTEVGASLIIVTHDKRLKDVFLNYVELTK